MIPSLHSLQGGNLVWRRSTLEKAAWLAALLLMAAPAAGQERAPADSTRTVPLGLGRAPLLVPVQFRLTVPEDLARLTTPWEEYVAQWRSALETRLAAAEKEGLKREPAAPRVALQPVPEPALEPAADTVAYLPMPVQRDTGLAQPGLLGGTVGRHADLALSVTGRGDLGGSWTRYEPCDPSLYFNCNPSLFPRLKPDVQFKVGVAGTISERIHVDVDYDQAREDFTAANNINLYYQGFADEVLQRVEVGDVALQLPQSRFLTQGVPAGNFGLTAAGQIGPIEFQTVWAQQKGDVSTREFVLGGGTGGGLEQDASIVLDDGDYAGGQFFFLTHPDSLTGAPHIDVLALTASAAPVTLRPEQGGNIEVYRDERLSPATAGGQGQLGLFLAEAIADDGVQRHSGQFRRLTPGQDYMVHASGLWIVLRAPLRSDEALAVSYRTESGDTVGTLNAETSPAGVTPVLRLLRSPAATHQPGAATWDYEMHQVYRVDGGTGVEASTVELAISLGELTGGRTFVDVNGKQVSFLRLFGTDEDAPADLLDQAHVYQPARDDLSGTPIAGTFVIFPTLRPFATPPPVPSEGLSADDALAALGPDANPRIYDEPDPVARESAGRFRLNFTYRLRADGLVSSFSLGALGIREGSEQLTFGGRRLERNLDYQIDYELGQVTLLDPQGLFGPNPSAQLRATWEQRSLFEIAPTSVYGLSTRYRLGERGAINLVGLYQAEKTLYNRPQLGVEPAAIFLGGASANLDLGGGVLDALTDRIPGMRRERDSRISLNGEVALSMPNPNRRGDAYLDDFESTDDLPIEVRRQVWRLGSRPETTEGAMEILPLSPSAADAAPLVWQHDILVDGGVIGTVLPQRDIDRRINVAGAQLPEAVMWFTFGQQGIPEAERRWRSITTVLSTTGRDLSRSEYLEFYVAAGGPEPMGLVFDIGVVGEDAFYVDSLGNTNGTYQTDGRPWGLGVLDEEARLAEREVWGTPLDQRGLWDQPCQAEPLQAYPLGDPRSNCARGNGIPDTEDLDGNGVLDAADGAYFRYVVRLDQLSPYLVRDTAATGTAYRLYRIPLRGAAGIPVNGASEATWRFVKHLRITIAGEPAGVKQMVLARMRIVGSRWTKRDIHGIQRGLLEAAPGLGATTAELQVGPVSRLTDGAIYTPPPGVRDEVQDPSAQFGPGGIEFNEKSLRMTYQALEPDDRAEIFYRYPQQPRNFLTYRQIRLWALAKQGSWGPSGDERLLIRLGTDARNYYLYQTRLHEAIGDRSAVDADWRPELVIDFGPWMELKAEAEQRLVARGSGVIGQDTLWSADSTYAIVFEDRARAPNLASIRELSFAVYNSGALPTSGEVWIDEMRLGAAFNDPGVATNLNLTVTGDFLSGTVSYTNRGPVFRQLNEDPSYRSSGDLAINTRAQLDRVLPATWGLDVPVTLTHTASGTDPMFLEGSDVRADRLDGLRETGSGNTRVAVRVAKRTPSANPLLGLLIDGLSLRAGYNASHTNTITSQSDGSGFDAGFDYRRDMRAREFDIIPAFLESLLRTLAPAALENSAAFGRLVGAKLRWTPETISFGTGYNDYESRQLRFDRILADSSDLFILPIEAPRRGLNNTARIALRPFQSLSASVDVRSTRDLLDAGRASQQPLERAALEAARRSFGGMDIGWEAARTIDTNLNFAPQLADWIRPTFTWNSRFGTDRNSSYLEIIDTGSDSTAILQRRFGTDRTINRRLDLRLSTLFADTTRTGLGGLLFGAGRSLRSVTFNWNSSLSSQFERVPFSPSMGYQFGWGGPADFRFIAGDTAAATAAREDRAVATTVALPGRTTFTAQYRDLEATVLDARGGTREQLETSWPNVRLNFGSLPIPSLLSPWLLTATASAGWEHVQRDNIYGTTNIARGSEEDRIPIEASLTFNFGLTALYTGNIRAGTSQDPTGDAENEGFNHSLRLSGAFAPPGFLKPKFTNPINTSIVFTMDSQQQCRFRSQAGSGESCVPFVDNATRTVDLSFDTLLSDLVIGLRLSYTDRQSHVGTRTGSSQFELGFYGQFQFEAGNMGNLRR